jgi:hypothetical protein
VNWYLLIFFCTKSFVVVYYPPFWKCNDLPEGIWLMHLHNDVPEHMPMPKVRKELPSIKAQTQVPQWNILLQGLNHITDDNSSFKTTSNDFSHHIRSNTCWPLERVYILSWTLLKTKQTNNHENVRRPSQLASPDEPEHMPMPKVRKELPSIKAQTLTIKAGRRPAQLASPRAKLAGWGAALHCTAERASHLITGFLQFKYPNQFAYHPLQSTNL